jgi:hypothetical protein
MIEPLSPNDRVIQRSRYRKTTWRRQVLILLGALVLLAAAPLSAAGRPPAPASADRPVSRIAFVIGYADSRGQIVAVNADGRGGVQQLVPGMHNNGSFCQSADGAKIAYQSDQEAPHEQFLYVANADGNTSGKKITESNVGFLCPFSERWLLLSKPIVRAMTIVRHDIQIGAERTVVAKADRFSLAPKGRKLIFVGGLDYTPVSGQARPKGKETLELLDLATLKKRRLAGPLARGKSFGFECGCRAWSPDGRRIAYTVGPSRYPPPGRFDPRQVPARRYAVYVQPVSGGAARLVLRLLSGPPSISWSPDGRRLLVCAPKRAAEIGCTGGHKGSDLPMSGGKLLLVDLAHRSVRRVASGQLIFAEWAPSGGTYAYATPAALYRARPGGTRRLLASAPKPHWPEFAWLGWSPDGRYIGLGPGCGCDSGLSVLNVATGKISVLFRNRKNEFWYWSEQWWR